MARKNQLMAWVSADRLRALRRLAPGSSRTSLDRLIRCLEAVEVKARQEQREPLECLESMTQEAMKEDGDDDRSAG